MDLSDRSRTLIEKSTSLPKALVAAIGVGVAFGGGLVIGGIGKADASVVVAPAVAADPIATALARTKAYEERMKAVDLTWHKELTAFDPALPPPPKPSSSTSKPTKPAPAPLSEEPSSSPIVDKAVVTAPPPPEPTVKVAARAADVDAGVADDDDDNVKAPDPKKLGDAITRVLGEKKKAEAAPSSTSDKRYALQLASTGTAASAKVLADGWNAKGVKAVVVSAEVAGKGTMYRVRVDGIASRAAADALKAKLGQGLVVAD